MSTSTEQEHVPQQPVAATAPTDSAQDPPRSRSSIKKLDVPLGVSKRVSLNPNVDFNEQDDSNGNDSNWVGVFKQMSMQKQVSKRMSYVGGSGGVGIGSVVEHDFEEVD